ncbi:MAG: PQQ-dependent sugar dehydrogenase [Planctomycetes bacterium]|nr:PQQ-dependent sugar dehydrogenase [Planctomycetota bacterium]
MNRISLTTVLTLFLARPALAVERWADPDLPVAAGLELWLEAARLEGALAARGEPALRENEPVRAWYDASGHHRHANQAVRTYQPLFKLAEAEGGERVPLLRFDGQDDFLPIARAGLSCEDFTLFVAAAPRSNAGAFRALLSAARADMNDYVTGFNLDLGSGGSGRFDWLNAEGAGFGGEANLLSRGFPFGGFHLLAVVCSSAQGKIRARADGLPAGERPRSAGTIHAGELRLGARLYRNEPGPPYESGFFHGDLAEILLYGRALGKPEIEQVENYLRKKHRALLQRAEAPPGPPVQVLAPGFAVKELPVELANVNNLLYIPGGRLLALGYDGRVHALEDTDGDGLEDQLEPFWYEPTLRVPIAMAWREEGLYVTSNQKLSLLRDTDGDGRADREEVIASGWTPPDLYTGPGVDSMGLAIDDRGDLYFGLGCADFTNAYRLKDGRPRYDRRGERGAILKIPAGEKRREIVCTGIRFPYTLAFNRRGDLFATDQEGETWLLGGNPLDELNHILPGRHYGFPPRHQAYLPDVIDEPPVVGFSPQHQSTCGLVFNEAKPGQKRFGPAAWEGDAFIAGFSRGKLWRVRLVKTEPGYIGKAELFACFDMLALAPAISPQGDLVIACHGGSPDWGNGPGGQGKLFKIFYRDPAAPRPVIAWAEGPLEARVAFDRPVDPEAAKALAGKTIPFGEHVRAGDRFEAQRPGYAAVQAQLEAPQGQLAIAAARLPEDGRTMILTTRPHPAVATYALTLPGRRGRGEAGSVAAADLAYDLNGVEASWSPPGESAPAEWTGWLPHLDLDVTRALAAGSREHEKLFELLQRPGLLRLRARIEGPPDLVQLHFKSNGPLALSEELLPDLTEARRGWEGRLEALPDGEPLPVAAALATGQEHLTLQVFCELKGRPEPRPLPLEWQVLPWAPPRLKAPPPPAIRSPED